MSLPTITPEQVVAAARGWRDVPYVHQGRSRAGVDCAGLVIMVAHELGASSFDVADYGRYPSRDRMRELMRSLCSECTGEPLPGMVAMMQFTGEPRHLGIVVAYRHGGVALVHALQAAGRVAEHRIDALWRSRITALFEMPGVKRV
ncbi:NlpC/P60 family protein [Methylibium sp.]|uniref:NlpC/P60 family protein n=1 Tax=Methylibium sp. TaxID=2067992 RepID=UPI00181846D6|nr:NlpC/P60 family protein [Methylibium sp.]MBA3588308.1 hypothetical protein [Methylibium sp.]